MNIPCGQHLQKSPEESLPVKITGLIGRELLLAIAAAVVAVFLLMGISGVVHAGEIIVKGNGTLTSVEQDRTVIIDAGGYNVPHACRIYNMDGIRIRLENLSVPVKVKFEYVNTAKGPEIHMIREMGE